MKKLISSLLILLMLFHLTSIHINADNEYAIKSISSGDGRTFFIVNDGKVVVSGSNRNGVAGLGTTALYTDTVMKVPYLSSVKNVVTSSNATYFLLNNGEVYSTGIGIEYSITPIKVRDIDDVSKVAVNGNSIVFLKNNGDLYVYGDNGYGQLGAGSASEIYKITKLSGVSGVKDVQMGDRFMVVLFEDGTIKVTGYDKNGRLGLGNSTEKIITTLTSLTNNTQNISKIAVGKTHILYLNNQGSLYGTADNGINLGLSNSNRVNTITKLTTFSSTIKSIVADAGSFVLLEDGSLWTCGYNSYGADFSKSVSDNASEFKKVITGVMDVSTGGDHTLLMMNNAEILVAGKNTNGELAIGNIGTNVITPSVAKNMYYAYGTKVTYITNTIPSNGILTFKHAVLVNGDINLDGSAKIQGDAASINGNIDGDWSTKITGNIYLSSGGRYYSPDINTLGGSVSILNPTYKFEMPTFIEPPTSLVNKGSISLSGVQSATISEDGYYDKITINSGTTLTINVGTGERIIHTKQLDVAQGFINIIGSGKLYIFLDDPFSLRGSSTFNTTNVQNVNIIIKNSGTIDLQGSAIFKGSIFAENANLSIAGSSSIVGNAVLGGNTVSMTGSTPLTGTVYAPYANISLQGSSLIKGAIIANSYTGIGATVVIFVESSLILPVVNTPTPTPIPEVPDNEEDPINVDPGIKLPDEISDELKNIDYELIFNVAKDGDKKVGAALGAYQDMLKNVDNSNQNNSLKRVSKLVSIFGEKFTCYLPYGTYNFYEE